MLYSGHFKGTKIKKARDCPQEIKKKNTCDAEIKKVDIHMEVSKAYLIRRAEGT